MSGRASTISDDDYRQGLADQVTRFYGHILTRGAEEAMRSAVAAEERT